VALLRGQQARKVDVVAPASAIRAENGLLVLEIVKVEIGRAYPCVRITTFALLLVPA
jgi:hypothetical protein